MALSFSGSFGLSVPAVGSPGNADLASVIGAGPEATDATSSIALTASGKPDVMPAISAPNIESSFESSSETTVIPYETVKEDDDSLYKGEEKVVTEGEDGVVLTSKTVSVSPSGEETVEQEVTVRAKEPVDEVIAVGTKEKPVETTTSGGGSSKAPSTSNAGSNRAIGKEMAAAKGWTGEEWNCLNALWTRESNWRHTADNPHSSAYGIPQSLPGSKMASAGSDWLTNPATQIKWGLGYIKGRYGSPCAAWGHSERVGWY